jgi:hypothetical protein
LGFRVEEFGSSGSAGSPFPNQPPTCHPQREACGEIPAEPRLGQTISPCEPPPDRPAPLKESPPQDYDLNSSSLNPMGKPLFLLSSSRKKGGGGANPPIDETCSACYDGISREDLLRTDFDSGSFCLFHPMAVKTLYLDFFKFLDRMPEGDPWTLYRDLYLQPHQKFLQAYWENYDHFNGDQISRRVKEIKKEDYGLLRAMVQAQDPGVLAGEAVQRCQGVFSLQPSPEVYLFVGFFSADGATVAIDGAPVIALGLERFKDFKDIPLLVAHEYCHCAQWRRLQNLQPAAPPLLSRKIMGEGLSVLFTQLVYPEIPLHRHLFLTPERLHWCRENEETLLDLAAADLDAEKLIPALFGGGDPDAGLPPRVGYFIARQMLGHCLSHHEGAHFGETSPGFGGLFAKFLQGGILNGEKE